MDIYEVGNNVNLNFRKSCREIVPMAVFSILKGYIVQKNIDLSFYKGKKVLITGHTGFKGSWLSKMLIQVGADLTGYSLEPPKLALYHIAGIERMMRSVIGDIRDLVNLKKVFTETRPEIVIHLAAQPLVRESYNNPVYTYETNVMGTVNVCECVRQSVSVKSFLNVTTDIEKIIKCFLVSRILY